MPKSARTQELYNGKGGAVALWTAAAECGLRNAEVCWQQQHRHAEFKSRTASYILGDSCRIKRGVIEDLRKTSQVERLFGSIFVSVHLHDACHRVTLIRKNIIVQHGGAKGSHPNRRPFDGYDNRRRQNDEWTWLTARYPHRYAIQAAVVSGGQAAVPHRWVCWSGASDTLFVH